MGEPDSDSAPVRSRTTVERTGERELVVTRTFDAPVHAVFEAWTTPRLFMRWWVPASMGVPLLSCAMDVREGGTYRLEFGKDATDAQAFFGRYLEVEPDRRLVWTNEEAGEGALTTVTFEDRNGGTLLAYHELHPSRRALDDAFAGMESMMPGQLEQLDRLLVDRQEGARNDVGGALT